MRLDKHFRGLCPDIFLSRYFWWRACRKATEMIRREKHLETLLDEAVQTEWLPRPTRSGDGEGRQAARSLRILYVAHKYDYGNPVRGLSYEENNFRHTLLALGHQIVHFDFGTSMRRRGRTRMSELLVEAAYRYQPDVMFVVLFKDEFETEAIRKLSSWDKPVTVNWFADDHWRFKSYSREWGPCFNWVVTTDPQAVSKYEAAGVRNVILSQWACNQWLYYKMDLPKVYDVTFIGQPHGDRQRIVKMLRRAGVDVRTWGYGWREGKIPQSRFVEVVNQSRINLNLANASVPGHDQIKGRNFEVPGCGGFLLTGSVAGLEEYYRIGEEIVCYDSISDLLDKIRYYLDREEERQKIAAAGYRRTLRDHTYERRLGDIFRRMGVV